MGKIFFILISKVTFTLCNNAKSGLNDYSIWIGKVNDSNIQRDKKEVLAIIYYKVLTLHIKGIILFEGGITLIKNAYCKIYETLSILKEV